MFSTFSTENFALIPMINMKDSRSDTGAASFLFKPGVQLSVDQHGSVNVYICTVLNNNNQRILGHVAVLAPGHVGAGQTREGHGRKLLH